VLGSSFIIIIVSLLFSAFFSGMEIAFISANRIHIELEKKQEGLLAKVLSWLTKKPSKFIATMLIGNNITLVIYGLYMGEVLMVWFQSFLPTPNGLLHALLTDFSLLSQTIISTYFKYIPIPCLKYLRCQHTFFTCCFQVFPGLLSKCRILS